MRSNLTASDHSEQLSFSSQHSAVKSNYCRFKHHVPHAYVYRVTGKNDGKSTG